MYQALYHLMFNAATDALNAMAQQNYAYAALLLRQAQQSAEAAYMEAEPSSTPLK